MTILLKLTFLLVFCSLIYSQEDIANKEIFSVEHEVNGQFVPRGQIHLVTKTDGKFGLVFPDKNGIYGNDIESFKRSLSENGLYKLRIRSMNGSPNVPSILTSIPAVSSFVTSISSLSYMFFSASYRNQALKKI